MSGTPAYLLQECASNLCVRIQVSQKILWHPAQTVNGLVGKMMLLQQEQVQNRFSILDILILYLPVFMVGSILFYSFRISTGAELPVVDMILFAFSFFDDIRFCVFAANIVFVYPVLNRMDSLLSLTLYQTRCAKFAAEFCRRYGGRQCFVGLCMICFFGSGVGREPPYKVRRVSAGFQTDRGMR